MHSGRSNNLPTKEDIMALKNMRPTSKKSQKLANTVFAAHLAADNQHVINDRRKFVPKNQSSLGTQAYSSNLKDQKGTYKHRSTAHLETARNMQQSS